MAQSVHSAAPDCETLPLGHAWQPHSVDAAPVNLPEGHALQSLACSSDSVKSPGGQPAQEVCSLLLNLPHGHAVHVADAVVLTSSEVHGAHSAASAALPYLPPGQSVHDTLARLLKVVVLQVLQLDEPCSAANLPAGHAAHTTEPSSEK